MKKLYIFASILSIAVLISCRNKSTEDCRIFNEEMNFQDQLFPFTFRDFKTSSMLKYFSNKTTVDSSELNNQGYITRTYNFSDGISKVSFLVKPYDTSDAWFYLRSSLIRSNIISFKNGIKIGMSRADFNKIINRENNCDTFLIQEGDMITSYFFIFKKNKLENIDILAPED